MTNSNYNEHTNPLYIEHGILLYDLLIKQSQLLFMHSIAYEYAPISFTGVWIKNADIGTQIFTWETLMTTI